MLSAKQQFQGWFFSPLMWKWDWIKSKTAFPRGHPHSNFSQHMLSSASRGTLEDDWLSTAMKSWKKPTAVTLGKSYRVCSMPSLQRITCPQHPLELQLTHFTVFTPSAVGKTWLMHFLALRLKNKMSLTGQNLLWWLPVRPRLWMETGISWLLSPCGAESSRMPTFLPSPNQPLLTPSVALRVGPGCTRSSLPLLYPNGSQGKAMERRTFSSKHEDGWQWGSNCHHSTCCFLDIPSSEMTDSSHLWSRVLFAKSYKKRDKETKCTSKLYCPGWVWVALLNATVCSVLVGSTLPRLDK